MSIIPINLNPFGFKGLKLFYKIPSVQDWLWIGLSILLSAWRVRLVVTGEWRGGLYVRLTRFSASISPRCLGGIRCPRVCSVLPWRRRWGWGGGPTQRTLSGSDWAKCHVVWTGQSRPPSRSLRRCTFADQRSTTEIKDWARFFFKITRLTIQISLTSNLVIFMCSHKVTKIF